VSEAPDVHLLSGAYAVGAVEPDEAAAFEAHLAGCAGCRDEVRSLRETVARLAEATAVAPPDEVKTRVFARLDAVRRESAGPPADAGPPGVPAPRGVPGPRRPLSGRASWLVAAVLAAVAAFGGVTAWNERQDAEQARRLASVLGAPSAQRITRAATGGGDVELVVSGGTGAIVTAGLPGLTDRTTYQLWIVRPSAVTSAGLGPAGPAAAGHWTRLVDGVRRGDTVAVSVEPSGGSQQPTTVPIVTLTV